MTQIQKKTLNSKTQEAINVLIKEFSKDSMRIFLETFVRDYIKIGDSPVYGGKHCGSDAEQKGARFIYDKLRDMGIKAEMLPFISTRFQFNDASITFAGRPSEIKPYACLSVPAEKGGITAQLADVEDGHKGFYENHDINGKIALIETKEDFEDGTIAGSFQMYEAEKNGAAAIVLYTNEYIYDEKTIRATYSAFSCGIPVVTISAADAAILKTELEKDQDFTITLTVDTEYEIEKAVSYEVIGEIPGITDERIVYSAHLDHFFTGVQDNVSAVATLLGIAKAIKESGYQPNRIITFVFSGSHEIGRVNSAAPDLLGPWELLNNIKKDWVGKIIANINFEYTAMSLKHLRSLTSYEMRGSYLDFLGYMPDKMAGFEGIADDILPEEYYLMTWCDACAFLMKGIPVFMNDTVYEQIYETTSPYIGRDHSSADNMDTYSSDGHVSSTCWYGCLGIYLDNKAVIEPDYTDRCKVLSLTDEERAILDAESIEYAEYIRQLESFEKKSRAAFQKLLQYNETAEPGTERALKINEMILKLQQTIAECADGLTTAVPSTIQIPHKVYMEKGMLFARALEVMEEEGWDAAYEKALRKMDMVGLQEKFSHDLILKIRDCILGENATWNQGKCKNVFTYEDVTPECLANSHRKNVAAIQEALDEETRCLKTAGDILSDIIFEATDHADEAQMMAWIKGFTKFPHRRTGTEEGLKSARYVEETFQSIGLEKVEMEPVKSICMDCTRYELTIDGQAIQCFFANGTNRREETGIFLSDIGGADIVYMNNGSDDAFDNVDVEGKLVLCDVYFKTLTAADYLGWCEGAELYDPHGKTDKPLKKYDIFTPNNWPYNYMRAKEKGAAGFIGILHHFMDHHYFHEDYTDIMDLDGYMELPAVWISKEAGEKIKAALTERPLTGNLSVHTEYKEGEARVVKGEIRGKSDEIILIQSHHDAVCQGAVQDASGMSVVFALAEYFSKLPKDMMEKTLMFVATDSHYTDYEGHVGFLENRKNNNEKIILDFAVEHVAQEMDLDDDNQIVLTGEAETRMLYVDDCCGLPELVKKAIIRYDLDKTVILPVKGAGSGPYTNDQVCSDASDFNAAGIPVISLLAAPMYLFHNTDTIDKVHKPSLVKILKMYAYMIMQSFHMF